MEMLPEFEPFLRPLGPETLHRDAAVIYGLTPDLRLAYFNDAWFAFAAANGGEPAIRERFGLGTCVLDAIDGPLRDYYEDFFAEALRTARHLDHEYECSSDDVYRRFHMTLYPLARRRGLLAVHSLVEEALHGGDRRPVLPVEARYRAANGIIVSCGHCRRFRRCGDPAVWDWVPGWVRKLPPGVSHGLCPLCLVYYYPQFR